MKLKYKANYAFCMNELKTAIQDLETYQMRMSNQYYDLGFNIREYSYNIFPLLPWDYSAEILCVGKMMYAQRIEFYLCKFNESFYAYEEIINLRKDLENGKYKNLKRRLDAYMVQMGKLEKLLTRATLMQTYSTPV